ncbi:MAG: preprotein translocase subunit SecG [Steroidobacteraceae bacterium]
MLRTALTVLQVFSSVAIIALVLIQRGKGADAGAGFGAGASGTVFGARGARTALSRATALFAAIFMLNSLALAYMGMRTTVTAPESVLDRAAQTAPVDSAPPAPAPGSVPAPAPSSGDTAPDR